MSESDFDSPRLAVGSVYGARHFRVSDDGDLLPIYSYDHDFIWKPGVNHAMCNGIPSSSRGHPRYSDLYRHGEDSCGLYAFYENSVDYASSSTVAGVVEGYGRVVLGDRGFRAEKARIVALYLPPVLDEDAEVDDSPWAWARWYQRPVLRWIPLFLIFGIVFAGTWLLGASLLVAITLGVIAALVTAGALGLTLWMDWDLAERQYERRQLRLCDCESDVLPCGLARAAHQVNAYLKKHDMTARYYWYGSISPYQNRMIRKKYASVPIYDSLHEMLRQHPTTPPPQPDKEKVMNEIRRKS